MMERVFAEPTRRDDDSDASREKRKGCTICGLAKGLHFYKSHPYSPQRAKAAYDLDALGINTDAIVGLDHLSFTQRVQTEGREIFKRGLMFEDYNGEGRCFVRVRVHDADYSHDIDLGEVRNCGHPPGRAIVEMFTGRGLVGNDPDPRKRIYIAQNEDWPTVFAHVVMLSPFARKREPALRVGQRVIVERTMSDKIHVWTPLSGITTAMFHVVHVDDIYAIA